MDGETKTDNTEIELAAYNNGSKTSGRSDVNK